MSKLTFVGAGKMGGAMLAGALKAGWSAAEITVIEPHVSPALAELAREHGFALNPAKAVAAQILLLGIKPQMLDAAAPDIAPHLDSNSVVVSILAGKSIANITARLPLAKKLVRAMPNTPAAIGRGITGAYPTPSLTADERETVEKLLRAMGQVVWVEREDLIDAVTAVSGSGPAYVFHLVEALASAGVEAGLPAELALKLARATVEGSGELLHREASTAASTLRENVTSPGGTTAAALDVLMGEAGLTPLMTRAVGAALNRARALAG